MDTKNEMNVKRSFRGFIDKHKVKAFSFGVITLCLVTGVTASILAIWDFTTQDTLWRTVSTCVVIAGGMMGFGIVNALYGPRPERAG